MISDYNRSGFALHCSLRVYNICDLAQRISIYIWSNLIDCIAACIATDFLRPRLTSSIIRKICKTIGCLCTGCILNNLKANCLLRICFGYTTRYGLCQHKLRRSICICYNNRISNTSTCRCIRSYIICNLCLSHTIRYLNAILVFVEICKCTLPVICLIQFQSLCCCNTILIKRDCDCTMIICCQVVANPLLFNLDITLLCCIWISNLKYTVFTSIFCCHSCTRSILLHITYNISGWYIDFFDCIYIFCICCYITVLRKLCPCISPMICFTQSYRVIYISIIH